MTRFSTLAAAALALLLATPALAADPPKDGFLGGAPIGYDVPPAPTDSEVLRMDLAMVRAAQAEADTFWLEEAYTDASAYAYDVLLPRFSVAAAAPLTTKTRPILAYMLFRALEDARYYVGIAKDANKRPRPYVEDPANVLPCSTPYLMGTEYQAYPSGHSTNGYTAALVLAAAMPERAQPLLARGVRYGENRVICGVHHPLDVAQGRMIALHYFEALGTNAEFKFELGCAQEENARALAGSKAKPFTPDCARLADTAAKKVGD